MLPWLSSHVEEARRELGQDWWPYGFAANRAVLDTFLRYHHEQGLSHKRLAPEQLFAPESLSRSSSDRESRDTTAGSRPYRNDAHAALVVIAPASGSPSSIGRDGSRDHSFHEPKYMRTSLMPAFFSARNVLEARAPLKQ